MLLALSDKEDIVKIEAITASENFKSDRVQQKLLEIANQNQDEFIVAWSVATLAINLKNSIDEMTNIRNKWAENELVQCSVSFYMAKNITSDENTLRFFMFLNSENHLTRGMVINLSDFFCHCKISTRLKSILIEHKKYEKMLSLIELLNSKLPLFE